MRPITLIFALTATLHLLCGTALAAGWTWPVRGPVITPYRNGDDPYAAGQHRGIDVGAPVGSRVVAAVGGTVTFVGVVGSSGLTVSERSADGHFDLSYLHLSAASVRRGEPVSEGAALGAVGTSGRRSAGAPHLHFGVREADSRTAYRDPLDFLAPPPAGDAPDPAPAPVPVAEPARPAPASTPVMPPAATPAPLPALPAAHPAPTLHTAPHPAPTVHAAPDPATTMVTVPGAPSPLAESTLTHTAHRPSRPAAQTKPHLTAHGPLAGPRSAIADSPSTHSAPSASPRTHISNHDGINLGWLAACIGLIAVATALGHPDATRRTAARGRSGLGALLRLSRGLARQ
jgi:hypothetical protein